MERRPEKLSNFRVKNVKLWQFNCGEEEVETADYGRVDLRIWLTNFFRETTMQGVPPIVKEPGILKKLFWVVAIALCAIGLWWELDAFFAKFLSWSATTSVSIATARILPFPAITICNNNPVTTDWYSNQDGNPMDPGSPPPGGICPSGPGAPTGNLQTSGGSGTGGASGPSGSSGAGGSSGTSGGSVPSGSSGTSGGSVPSGSSGTSGGSVPSGSSGTSGGSVPSGSSGTSGGSAGMSTPSTSSGGTGVSATQANSATGVTKAATVSQGGATMPSGGSGPPGGGGAPPGGRKKRQVMLGPPGGPLTSGAQATGGMPGPQGPQGQKVVAVSYQRRIAALANASTIKYSERAKAGHQLCDMVMEMQYQGVKLDPGTNFTSWHWNANYGNCYTFNAGYTKAESGITENNAWLIKKGIYGYGIRNSSQSGDADGLYLLLNADIDHYLYWTTQVGWRIVIHNQTEAPFPEESGVFVAPGTSTRIGLSMSYIKRLGIVPFLLYNAPYSDCVDDPRYIPDDPRNAYSNMLEVSYTKSACLKTCYQQNVMKSCGCFDFKYPSRGSAFAGANTDIPCRYDHEDDWNCKEDVLKQYQNNTLDCDCPDTCTSYSFDTAISYLKWPGSGEYKSANDPCSTKSVVQTVCSNLYEILTSRVNNNDSTCVNMSYLPIQASNYDSSTSSENITSKLEECMNNVRNPLTGLPTYDQMAAFTVGSQFAEVYIFYKDFNYQTIVESEFLEFADLLAYMGGILGLFFGFTFLTLFEYIQLLIDLLIIGIGRLFSCGQNNKTADASMLYDPRIQASFQQQQQQAIFGQGPMTRRRTAYLNNKLRPGSVQSEAALMPPTRPVQSGDPNYDGLPPVSYDNAFPPAYVGMSKRY